MIKLELKDVLTLFSNLSNNNMMDFLNGNGINRGDPKKFGIESQIISDKSEIKEISKENWEKTEFFFLPILQKIKHYTRKASLENKNKKKYKNITEKIFSLFLINNKIRNLYAHTKEEYNIESIFLENKTLFNHMIRILSNKKMNIDSYKEEKEIFFLYFIIPFLKKHEYKLFLKIIKDHFNDKHENFEKMEHFLFKYEKNNKNIKIQDKKIFLLINLINNFYKINCEEDIKNNNPWKRNQIFKTFYSILEFIFYEDERYKVINLFKNNAENIIKFFGKCQSKGYDKNNKGFLKQDFGKLEELIANKKKFKSQKTQFDNKKLKKYNEDIKKIQREINKKISSIQLKTKDFFCIPNHEHEHKILKGIYQKRYIAILDEETQEKDYRLINVRQIIKLLNTKEDITKEDIIEFVFKKYSIKEENINLRENNLKKSYKNNYKSPNIKEIQLLKFIFKIFKYSNKYKLKNNKEILNKEYSEDLVIQKRKETFLNLTINIKNNEYEFFKDNLCILIKENENNKKNNDVDEFIESILNLNKDASQNLKNKLQELIMKYLNLEDPIIIKKLIQKNEKKIIKYKKYAQNKKYSYNLNDIFKTFFNIYKNMILKEDSKEEKDIKYIKNINIIDNSKNKNNIWDLKSEKNKEISEFYKKEFENVNKFIGTKIKTSATKWNNFGFNPHEINSLTYNSMQKFCDDKNRKDKLVGWLKNFKNEVIWIINDWNKTQFIEFYEKLEKNDDSKKITKIRNGILHLDPKNLIDCIPNFDINWYKLLLKETKKIQKDYNEKN